MTRFNRLRANLLYLEYMLRLLYKRNVRQCSFMTRGGLIKGKCITFLQNKKERLNRNPTATFVLSCTLCSLSSRWCVRHDSILVIADFVVF